MLQLLNVRTIDNINIAIDHYSNGFDNVVIIAPGWCMTKDSFAFKKIAHLFSKFFDVLIFDFRGHGKSGGFYTFTAREINDLDIVVKFALEKNYKKIFLVGFSLGAALSIIYSALNNNIDKVIAVSAPSDFSKIENHMWRKEAWWETLKKFEFKRFLSIRPFIFPLKKIKPIDLIKQIKVPTLFIAGDKDPTVHSWHTELLFNEALCEKEYKLFKDGFHAEDLFLHFEEDFFQKCLRWLEK